MLGLEWSTDVGEDFTESEHPISDNGPPSESSMFHGTIDLIGSSDEDYESDLVKTEDATPESEVSAEDVGVEYDEVAIQADVSSVVKDIVHFVERNTLFPEIGFDPNGAFENEDFKPKEGSCAKPHCQMGCLCSSLRGAFQHVPTHCSKERCMFDCHCQEKGLSVLDDERHYADKSKRKKKIPNRFKDVVLGRAYKKLHARTIYDNHSISDSDSDFESQLRLSYKKTSPVQSPPKVPSPELKKEGSGSSGKADNSWIHSDKIANIKKTIQERRIGFVSNTMTEDQTLADVNIWCSQHNKYSCLCINYVYFAKTNFLLWKPSNKSRLECNLPARDAIFCNIVHARDARYLANKVMFEMLLKEPAPKEVPFEVCPYNRNNHCARTFGALLDYNVRNKDEFFITKRKLELDHNVLSYSNSYVKFKNFLLMKASDPGPSAEPFNRSGKRKTMGKLVNIVGTTEKVKVDVGEEDLDVKVDYQLDEISEEDDTKTKVVGRKRKLTQKMKAHEEKKKEKEADVEDTSRIQEEIKLRKAMEEVPAKVPRKRGRPPKPKPTESTPLEKPLEVTRRPSDGERSVMREPTPEVELIPRKKNGFRVGQEKEEVVKIKQEPPSPDYFSAESRMDMEPEEDAYSPVTELDVNKPRVQCSKTHSKNSSKALKDCRDKEFREDIPKPFLGFSDCEDNSELEDSDDLVDSVHSKKVLVLSPRNDGYPHLGLLCLIPGVGYLNVTESQKGRIVVVDPINPGQRQSFNTLQHANDWLNRFFRSKVVFSTPDLVLQWILVTPGVLKLKKSKPIDPKIFHDPNMVITKTGPMRFEPSHRKNLNVANNCSLLRKQLSEHSVFRSLINKQLATRDVTILDERWVPNPKFGKKPENSPAERRFHSDSLASLQRVQNVSIETSVGCVTVHRLPPVPTEDKSKPPQLTPVASTSKSGRFDPCVPQVTLRPLPSLTKILNTKPNHVKIYQKE